MAAADAQRDACLEAAADDEAAFSAVAEAMKMPRDTAEEKEARRRRLSEVRWTRPGPRSPSSRSAAELVDAGGAGAADRQPQPGERRRRGHRRRPRRRHDGPAGRGGEPAGIDDDAARADLVSAVAVVEDLARRADEIEAEVRKRMRR